MLKDILRTQKILRKTQICILGFFCLHLDTVNATEPTTPPLTNSEIIKIAYSDGWRRITDYESIDKLSDPSRFFLSDVNNFDPESELRESIIRLTSKNFDEVKAFECLYPARSLFIYANFNMGIEFDPSNCSDFGTSLGLNKPVKNVSLLFVNGYLKNPASFFGHVMLKFGNESEPGSSGLLDATLNYGANTGNDPSVPYIVKGLFGFYDANFQNGQFFRTSALHQDLQSRDIWEYPLHLDEFQTKLLLASIYESLTRHYQYFFISDNCAFRIGRALGLVYGKDPIPRKYWSSPIDLLFGLKDQKVLGKPIHHPSQRTKVITMLKQLTPKQKDKVSELRRVRDLKNLDLTAYRNPVLLTYLEELNFKKHAAFKNSEPDQIIEIEDRRRSILLALNPEKLTDVQTIAVPPSNGNYPTRLRLTADHIKPTHEKPERGLRISLRGSNFSILEDDAYRATNSEFIFLAPELMLTQSRIKISAFTLFSVKALNDNPDTISGEPSFAWEINAGRSQLSSYCYPCSINAVSGSIGKSYRLAPLTSVSVMMEAMIHQDKFGLGNASFTSKLLGIKQFGVHKVLVQYRYRHNRGDNTIPASEFEVRSRWNISQRSAVEISANVTHSSNAISFSIDRYF